MAGFRWSCGSNDFLGLLVWYEPLCYPTPPPPAFMELSS